MDRIKQYGRRLLIVLVILLVLFLCGLGGYGIWVAMGQTVQQVVIGLVTVAFVWNCVLPVLAVFALITVIVVANYFLNK